jgi:hypothetical protein
VTGRFSQFETNKAKVKAKVTDRPFPSSCGSFVDQTGPTLYTIGVVEEDATLGSVSKLSERIDSLLRQNKHQVAVVEM